MLMISVQFVFRELLTVQNGIDAINYVLHLVHSWGGADPNWMVPVCHLPMSEEECRRVNLPYGFDGVMFALGKHVNQHQAINNNYVKYRTHHFEHIRVMSECLAC